MKVSIQPIQGGYFIEVDGERVSETMPIKEVHQLRNGLVLGVINPKTLKPYKEEIVDKPAPKRRRKKSTASA